VCVTVCVAVCVAVCDTACAVACVAVCVAAAVVCVAAAVVCVAAAERGCVATSGELCSCVLQYVAAGFAMCDAVCVTVADAGFVAVFV